MQKAHEWAGKNGGERMESILPDVDRFRMVTGSLDPTHSNRSDLLSLAADFVLEHE